MGLKWFRARLSINKKEAYKVPTMTGIYRKVSFSESNILATRKNQYTFSAVSSSTVNDPTSVNDKEQQNDRTKEGLASQSSSSNTNSERDAYATRSEEPTTSTKDSNAVEQSSTCEEETDKMNEDKNHISDKKVRICQDPEIVI